MAAKQMKFETDARAEIATGLTQLARAVKITLGPRGRNVVLQKSFGSPRVTKDGVTVSKEIELPEPFANMGAKLVNMVASKTGDVAGDGTTTATVLAQAIVREGLKNVAAGANPMGIKRGIAASLANLGIIAHELGDYEAARQLYEESRLIQRELGDLANVVLVVDYQQPSRHGAWDGVRV